MRPSRPLTLLPALLAIAIAPAALAANASYTASGKRLALSGDCAREIRVTVTPGQGPITVAVTADRPGELAPFRIEETAEGVRFGARDDCDRGGGVFGANPTARIAVTVPRGTPLTLDASSSAAWDVGDIEAPVRVDLSGSGRMRLGRVGALTADLSGSGTVHLAAVTGPVRLDASGSGELSIDAGNIDGLEASLSGSGHLTIARGQVARARIEATGSGGVSIGGTLGDLDADLSGSGGIRVARLTGRLRQESSGSGEVEIDGR